MYGILRVMALTVFMAFSFGTVGFAAEPAPQPAPTDEQGTKDPSGPKLQNEKDEQTDKKDEKGN